VGPMYTSTLRGRIVWIRIVVSWWLVWRSGNGVSHINKVKLRRARLVLGLVTTIVSDLPSPYYILAHSTSLVGRCSEYWRVTVLATAGEETASSVNQWALLPALLARAVCCFDPR